jgi:putative ABC transport system permease protein
MEIRPILSAMLRNKTGALLVALQVALSLAILSNALYIVVVRQEAAARPTGIQDENAVFTIRVSPINKEEHAAKLVTRHRELAALRGVAGVVAASDVDQIPLGEGGRTTGLSPTREQLDSSAQAAAYATSTSLLATWGLQLVEGRDFRPSDVLEVNPAIDQPSPDTAIVTKALAEALYPGSASVVGKMLYYGTGAKADGARIIGIVARLQTIHGELGKAGELSFIAPKIDTSNDANYTVRAETGQRERVIRDAETALRAANNGTVVIRSATMEKTRNDRYRADRALSWMLISVSALLLLVTASGIVGIASLWVTQRRKQIGVGPAPGGGRGGMQPIFLTENIMITSAGIIAGMLLALALNQLLVSTLELARLPPVYLLGGCGLFWALGLGAVYGPAWRAASISPATATRGT